MAEQHPDPLEITGLAVQWTRGDEFDEGDTDEPLPSPGAQIGRYVVLHKLGAGAMGVVLAAYDPELDRKVAVKLLDHQGDDEAAQLRLQREAQALAKLDHPNVVAVHDVGVHDGRLFIAMEFVPGPTLAEWMRARARPRPWPEVLDVFLAAARGLAAAHEAGLVHRDFKPENVIVGDDGRVRVMDFGLARAVVEGHEQLDEDEAEARAAAIERLQITSSQLALSSPLTRTGALLGTPAFMAPEQFEGRPADARSDQFAFCIALHEALYGERPFAGETISTLLFAINEAKVRPAPRSATVPAWLRKRLLRGLSADPQRRYPSMQALTAALHDDPLVRRRRRWLAASALAIAIAAGWGVVHAAQAQAQVCAGAADKLAGVWDDERRDALAAAFAATERPYAADTLGRVADNLDDYAQRWVETRTEACEASQRGEQSDALLDLRMACLDERLTHLSETVQVLEQVKEGTIPKAVQVSRSLPPLARCEDLEALTAAIPPPEDPLIARAVTTLERRLAAASVRQEAGEYDEALAIAREVSEGAGALSHPPLQARAWLRLGLVQQKRGEYEASEAALREAYAIALSQGMLFEASEAAAKLLYVVGYALARSEDTPRWLEDADYLSQAAGSPELRAQFLNNRGTVRFISGDYEQARADLEQALALREQALGEDHPQIIQSLNNLGLSAMAIGDTAEAKRYLERSLAITERVLGPDHPGMAEVLSALGNVAGREDEYEQARTYLERALTIRRNALGPDHPLVADTLHNIGAAAQRAGDHALARDYLEAALATQEKSLGSSHPSLAPTLNNLGTLALEAEDFELARDYFARALALRESALGPHHPLLSASLTGLAKANLSLGDHEQARALLERDLAREGAYVDDPPGLAGARLALADVLWATPERTTQASARGLIEQTRAELADGDPSTDTRLAAWLDEHPL
ncbi:tetratricopeptide repeat protein [Pseudenhygromyxa sp. WMMC2535]|uniref:tetratricopeptide repeat protein n=1 Tax=Pseudenhygromyxa sp. WMMC2535 TaxID=2712867 RepID=UPI001551A3F7|nr:tetratricopeptide repeat protein [Pseudenhygromyxa sp. WMMC2535]